MHHTLPQSQSQSRSQSRSLVARLHEEWDMMRVRPALLRRAAEWGVALHPTTLDDLLVCTGFRLERPSPGQSGQPGQAGQPGQPGHAGQAGQAEGGDVDQAMARLLVVARTDELAARVVLQRLLPGLSAAARRWPARRGGGSLEPLDELVGAAWSVIREYPLERRPNHLVANLLRDCEYRAFIRSTRRLLVHEPTAPHLLDRPCAPTEHLEPLHELLAIAAQARTLTDDDRRLLGLLLSGRSTIEVAAALKVSERTVRTYRAAMVERLRQGVLVGDVVGDVAGDVAGGDELAA